MSARLVSAIVLALLVSACSSTSDRYAVWRDSNAGTYPGTKPNLGDVPVTPNVANAKAEMDAMRQRLEKDRDDANMAVQTLPAPTQPITMTSTSISNNDASTISDIQTSPLASPQPAQQNNGGNVVYNYGTMSSNVPYTYGYSPVNIRTAAGAMPVSHYASSDPSVSVDWSALGGNEPAYTTAVTSIMAPMALYGEPVLYFKYGSAQLSAHDKNNLRSIAERIKAKPNSVVIIGHASKPTGLKNPMTAQEVNLKMSTQRATAVLHQLAHLGVQPDKVNVAAYGDTMAKGIPAKDQRVDIKFND